MTRPTCPHITPHIIRNRHHEETRPIWVGRERITVSALRRRFGARVSDHRRARTTPPIGHPETFRRSRRARPLARRTSAGSRSRRCRRSSPTTTPAGRIGLRQPPKPTRTPTTRELDGRRRARQLTSTRPGCRSRRSEPSHIVLDPGAVRSGPLHFATIPTPRVTASTGATSRTGAETRSR